MSNPSEAKCPRCAAPLPPSAPEGLCPRCLGALNLLDDTVLTGAPPVPAQPTLTPAELAPHFPQLEIIECLGRGGMGVVYKARQKSLNRVVALKLLAPERVTDAGFAERFTREAQALARLNHPNIVTIYDFGCTRAGGLQPPSGAPSTPSDGGCKPPAPPLSTLNPQLSTSGFFFLLMEFMDGVNLRQAMKAGRFTPEQALAIVPPVCEALQYAHEHGIIHRDIKPENLLLDKAGRIKIADFGIAKILEPGRAERPLGQPEEAAQQRGPTTPESFTAGTPGYMAPEQKSAPQRVDSRADIYSLGVVIYEMLTGELPAAQLQPPSRKVQIDVRLDEIVLRALEQRPELRYQTAADLRTQVETFERADSEERIEKSKQPPALSSIVSPPSSPPRPFLKIGTSTLTTPEQLNTVEGQVFCYRTRGQLILDDRQLTHSLAGVNTIIPLAAIRDLSIGHYPRSMNPAGLDVLSVTYEEGGQRKQVLLSPMEGWFGFPSTFNARVAEWLTAIRMAVIAATGRAPATTPADKLGVPGSSKLLLAVACVPFLIGAGLLLVLVRGPGTSSSFASGAALLSFVVLLLGFLAPVLFGWLSRGRNTSGPGSSSFGKFSVLLMVLVPMLLLGFLALSFVPRNSPTHSDVTRFETSPVGVSNNVVLVDVSAESARWSFALRPELTGPTLPRETEAALVAEFRPTFAVTVVRPALLAANQRERILSGGQRHTLRLAFVLPTTELAEEAFRSIRPIGPLPTVPSRTHAGTLFVVREREGAEYHAALQVGMPKPASETGQVTIGGRWQRGATNLTFNFEVSSTQPGTVKLRREGNLATTSLQLEPKAKRYRSPVTLELSQLGTNRVLLVSRLAGVTTREEHLGDFRELAAELSLGTNSFGANAAPGDFVELCQFQGKSFTVQVDAAVPRPESTRQPMPVPYGFHPTLVSPVWKIIAVVVVLVVVVVGIVLLVVLMRKGGTGGKIALVLVGAAGLFVAVALAALFGWRKMASDFGPGVGLVRLSKSGQMTLESNYPAPAQPHPPGEVQQTQNGFRLHLPAAQLATFEFFIRQADDSWQPVPSLTALVATGKDGGYHDSLYWTLRRGNRADGTNQLWFWTVSANANGGRPLPQLTDHGTNFAHTLIPGDTLDWWHLSTSVQTVMKPGEQQIIPLFRTHGTANEGAKHSKEAFLRVRCEPLPAGLNVAPGQHLVEAGLAAHALLEKALPAKPLGAAAPRKISYHLSSIKSSPVADDNSPAALATAQQQGIASATEDIQAGVLRILAYGDLIPTSPEDKDDETGFRIQWVAGSFLSDAFRAETDAYNFAMRDWFWKNRPDWSAAVTLLLLDADGKPMPLTTVVFTVAEEPKSKAGARGPIATRLTDDLGFIHAFSAPTNGQWSVAIVRNGQAGPRSAPIATSVAVNARGGPPNYLLELRPSGATPGDALLTPLSSEANQAAPRAASDQVLVNRLALASLLQKLHQLPATSDEPGALWLPVPGAAVPVTKRVEVAAQIERLRRLIRTGGEGNAASPSKAAARSASIGSTFSLRHKLASDMVDQLRSILSGQPGHEAKPSANNQEVIVTVPPDVMKRVQTCIAVTDWPDGMKGFTSIGYLQHTVDRTARSFFYACAIENSGKSMENLLSLRVLAELKGGERTAHYEHYQMGGIPDPAWEKSLRADWPGKKEALQRLVREWNRYPLKSIREEAGVAMGFGVKHFCSVAFEGAPKEFYQVTIEPARTAAGTSQDSFYFSSLPPWWKDAPGAAAVRYRPAAVSADVRREVDAFIQKYRGASDTEVMESVEFKQAFGKVREVINTPQMQATIAKALKEISGTKKGSPSMLVIGSETAQGLDSPKNRALFEAAFSGDAELIRAWLTNTLGGAVFEFAFNPALKESSGGVHVKELPAKQRPAVGAALRETNQPPPQAAAPLIRREVKSHDTLATMQSDLAALLLTHGQQHPKVVELRARIAALAGAETQAGPGAKAAAAPLIRREVKQANPGGKDLVMTFEELQRDAKTSTATVKHVSGASVPSAMFIARGAYDIARARGAAYFINLKEWEAEGGARMYLIGFAPDKNVDLKTYFDLKEPLSAGKPLLFMAVSTYERIFKDQP